MCPNWCSNTIYLTHDDPKMIQRAVDAKKNFLQEFIPCPSELLDNGGWYDWNISNWGTKWDIELENVLVSEGKTLSAYFSSAWSPPVEAYAKLEEMGFKVLAFYHEPGMCFGGRYENGTDECYEIDFYNDEWAKDLPTDLAEYIEPDYLNWLEAEEEYETQQMEKHNENINA
jgi:hypothetical protein